MPTSVRSVTPWRYEKLTPGQPTSNAIASRSELTVSPVRTDQWPGAPAGAPVAAAGAGSAMAAEAVSRSTAISARVRGMRPSGEKSARNLTLAAARRTDFPLLRSPASPLQCSARHARASCVPCALRGCFAIAGGLSQAADRRGPAARPGGALHRGEESARHSRNADLRRQGVRGGAGEFRTVRAARLGEAAGIAPHRGVDGDGRSGGGAGGGSRSLRAAGPAQQRVLPGPGDAGEPEPPDPGTVARRGAGGADHGGHSGVAGRPARQRRARRRWIPVGDRLV